MIFKNSSEQWYDENQNKVITRAILGTLQERKGEEI